MKSLAIVQRLVRIISTLLICSLAPLPNATAQQAEDANLNGTVLYVPVVTVAQQYFSLELVIEAGSEPISLLLDDFTELQISSAENASHYDLATGLLSVPAIAYLGQTYWANFELISESPVRFRMKDAGLNGDPATSQNLQLASHRFLLQDQSVPLGNVGTLLEIVDIVGQETVSLDTTQGLLQCRNSGIACTRSLYSHDTSQNQVQTSCTICIQDTGSCQGRVPVGLNLEMFLAEGVAGEANYLAQGGGNFYKACETDAGLRLEVATKALPPLMLRVVDAMGKGPISIDNDEIDLLRTTRLHNFSGEQLDPDWLVLMGAELQDFELHADGSITVTLAPCSDAVVFCTDHPTAIEPGDTVAIYHEFPGEETLAELLQPDNAATLDAFMAAHGIESWQQSDQLLVPEPRQRILDRLIALELMREHLDFLDEAHQLSDRGIRIAWFGFLPRRGSTELCHPSEAAICSTIEAEVRAEESRVIEQWRTGGFEVWGMNFLKMASDGSYVSLSEEPPDYSLFDGIILDINLNASPPFDPGVNSTNALVDGLTEAADELGSIPVMISPWAGPMDFYTAGTFCEAEICASDFSAYFAMNEALFAEALELFPGDQLKAFILPLFDGSQFDIRSPQELRSGITLNRVGETGFNNPLLNIYLSQ